MSTVWLNEQQPGWFDPRRAGRASESRATGRRQAPIRRRLLAPSLTAVADSRRSRERPEPRGLRGACPRKKLSQGECHEKDMDRRGVRRGARDRRGRDRPSPSNSPGRIRRLPGQQMDDARDRRGEAAGRGAMQLRARARRRSLPAIAPADGARAKKDGATEKWSRRRCGKRGAAEQTYAAVFSVLARRRFRAKRAGAGRRQISGSRQCNERRERRSSPPHAPEPPPPSSCAGISPMTGRRARPAHPPSHGRRRRRDAAAARAIRRRP